jgi:uncharacterized C2H2 Zn-finger protein
MFYDPLPEAEKIPEENEALFNSQRDYLKQVNRFKEHLKSRED